MNITPTLFIGAGTSGLSIINSVRELLFEEFLTPGLPCLRFLNITSHKGGEKFSLPNVQFTEKHQQIDVVEIPIMPDQYRQVPFKIDSESHIYDPGLAEWFPKDLSKLTDTSLMNGMQNNRKLGRLALWLNWPVLSDAIQRELGVIQTAEVKRETNQFIINYLTKKNVVIPDGADFVTNRINVVLVGTLLGGTCSGTFLDLAFYIRQSLPIANLIGIFTLLDSQLADTPNNSLLAANAYAALKEIDYYSQNGTVFDYRTPQALQKINNMNGPFHHVSFITTKNMLGTSAAIIEKDGSLDLESLHKMIGLTMFFEAISGAGNALQTLRTNWTNEHFKPLPVPPRYLKNFTSFGAVALWYPKSKISGAAAADYIANKLCSQWLGGQDVSNENLIAAKVDDLIKKIHLYISGQLTTFIDENGLTNDVNSHWRPLFNEIANMMSADQIDIQTVQNMLLYQPKDQPVGDRFRMNGYYYQKMAANLEPLRLRVTEHLTEIIVNEITVSISSVFNKTGTRLTIYDLQRLVNRLLQNLQERSRKSVQPKNSGLDFKELDPNWKAIEIEMKRTSTALIGAKKDIIKEYSTDIQNGILFLIQDAQKDLIDYFVNRFISENLQKIHNSLIVIVNKIREKIAAVSTLAVNWRKDLASVRDYPSLKIILRQETIEDEIKTFTGKIENTMVITMFKIIVDHLLDDTKTENSLFFQLLNALQTSILSLPEMYDFSILTVAKDAEIVYYAKNAEPMFEPREPFARIPYPVNQYPTMIGGGDAHNRARVKTLISNQTNNKIGFDSQIDLGHLFYVYKEEAGIAISEFRTFHSMEKQYQRGHMYGNHLDMNPDRFDIERHLTLEQMQKERWFKVAQELFNNDIFDGVKNNRLQFTFTDEDAVSSVLYFTPDDEADFLHQLSENRTAFKEFERRFNAMFRQNDRPAMRVKVNELLAKKFDELSDNMPKYNKEKEFYDELIKKRYPAPAAQ